MSDQSKFADLVHQEYEQLQRVSRRQFLGQVSLGLGAAALGSLMGAEQAVAAASKAPLSPLQGAIDPLHFAPKAKRVIFLCMAGGPSHLETFDYKPTLAKMDGKAMPESYTKGQPIAQLQGKKLTALGPQKKFSRHGKGGLMISDWLPNIGSVADEICVVKSMVTEQINHDPAHTFMNTGTAISGRPSMGSWVNYGLGSMTDDLPGFCVLVSDAKSRNPQPIASRQWSAGFLPSKYSGVELNSIGDPVNYVKNPPGINRTQQDHLISAVKDLNRLRDQAHYDPEIESRIAQYELAFKMQMAVPELTDLADEKQETLDMYGATPGDGSFASNCLMARRLAERGVRFIHLYHRGWDHHDGLIKHMDKCCLTADQATAALIKDLKQRGMLEDTLVVWGGEFGRTPMSQRGIGRDHHIKGFSMFMAGGGVKGGTDAVIEPNVVFAPGVTVKSGARIRAFSHLEGAVVGAESVIGPFVRLRLGAELESNVKIGNFVEVKNTKMGAGAQASHLSYLGDGEIGAGANIGAGTIFCNYDGFLKHKTTVGKDAFIGSNSALVAPVTIGDGAFVGSGSVITKDVEANALAVARGRQMQKAGWATAFRDKMAEIKAARKKG